MRTGDQILAINGESLHNKTVPEAVQMLQQSGDVITLKICKSIKKSSEGRGGGKVGEGSEWLGKGRGSRGVREGGEGEKEGNNG